MPRFVVVSLFLFFAFSQVTVAQNGSGPGNITQVLADLQAEIDALDARVIVNEANIATNASDIATNASGIATNASGIATNASDIATNASGIATNASDIATNASGISTNSINIAALNAVANATLEERVSGKTYIIKTTGHGSGGTNPFAQDPPPESDVFVAFLEGTQRDFSVAEGNLVLNLDGRYNLELSLTIIILRSDGIYIELLDIPINAVGDWQVVPETNEIVLENDNGEVQRLQSTPSGEVLTVVSNDQRLVQGDPTNLDDDGDVFNTFISDAVYIQLPESM